MCSLRGPLDNQKIAVKLYLKGVRGEMFNALEKTLSKRDAINLIELIHDSLSCAEEEDLRELIRKLCYLMPCDFAICGLGQSDNKGIVQSYDIININYPAEWLELYTTKEYYKVDPITIENFSRYKLQYWADTYKRYQSPRDFICVAEDFGLRNGYTHGARNPDRNRGSIFTISGNSIKRSHRTEVILERVVPHFHQAFVRIVSQHRTNDKYNLSSREKEVLKWIKEGKSRWDISVILCISERTVKYHISNIMQKLDAVSRTHALAIAIEQGLIDID